MFYNMFLLDDVFASLSPSKSMFANVNFCNLSQRNKCYIRVALETFRLFANGFAAFRINY